MRLASSRGMISDPVRLAFGTFQPADGGPPLDADAAAPVPGTMTFDELLQGLNPLHHLPVVGTIYRGITGQTIQPALRVLGGGLFGGPPGMVLAAIMAMVAETRPGAAVAALRHQDGGGTRLTEAQMAYRQQGNGLG